MFKKVKFKFTKAEVTPILARFAYMTGFEGPYKQLKAGKTEISFTKRQFEHFKREYLAEGHLTNLKQRLENDEGVTW